MLHAKSLHERVRHLFMLSLLCVAVAGLAGCGGDEEENPNEPLPPVNTDAYISGVAVGGTGATYHAGSVPAGEGGAPSVVGASQIVRGGSVVLEVELEDTVQELYLAIGGAAGGYYAVDMTGGRGAAPIPAHQIAARKGVTVARSPQTSPGGEALITYNVTVTSAASAPSRNFTIQVGANHGETVSALASHAVVINDVAQLSDKLQVSLNWTQPVDLDLHVEVPGGTTIFFANPVGPNGGRLDLDSNPGCLIDNVNNENITWNDGDPATGTFKVRVNLWSACEQPGPFPYAVTVNIQGGVQVFEGTITAGMENPGGDGILITEFDYPPAGT